MTHNFQNIETKPGARPDEVWMCCPFCTDERFRLGVNLRTGQAHCFNCNWKSAGEKTFQALSGLEYVQAFTEEPKQEVLKKKLPDDFALLWGAQDEFAHRGREYLKKRGVTDRQMQRKKIGYSITGLYAYRVIFPIWNRQRTLVGFVSRDWTGTQELKYKNSDGLEKTLYNAHLIETYQKRGYVILVEGPMDCLAVERANYPACGVLGRSLTAGQVDEVKNFKRIFIMLDWDAPGIQAGLETASLFTNTKQKAYVAIPENGKKDAGVMTQKEIQKSLLNSRLYTPGLRQELEIRFAKESRL